MNDRLIAGTLAFMLLAQGGSAGAQTASTQQAAAPQQAIPDAPRPQLVPGMTITPGKGTTSTSNGDLAPADTEAAPGTGLRSTPAVAQTAAADDGPAPELPAAGEGAQTFTLRARVNFVEIPFTVKDSKNRLVPGLTWRDVRVYENGLRQHLDVFTVDPFPLSVALVIDQSLPFDTMTKVNNSLGAL